MDSFPPPWRANTELEVLRLIFQIYGLMSIAQFLDNRTAWQRILLPLSVRRLHDWMVPKKDGEEIFLSQGMAAMLCNREKPHEIMKSETPAAPFGAPRISYCYTPPPHKRQRDSTGD